MSRWILEGYLLVLVLKTEAETEASSAVAQFELGLVFGEYRAEEVKF